MPSKNEINGRDSDEYNGSVHNALILEQFTRQAGPFANAAAIRNREFLNLILEMAEPQPEDTILDVACGPGLLTCAFAHVVRHATGIDLTPAMLEQARLVQEEQNLRNIAWEIGDASTLPYSDATFSIVATRFTFHHFLDPSLVLREMRRVCKPGGRVVVADSAPEPLKANAFNAMEKLRDPSHARALPVNELRALFAEAGFIHPTIGAYRLEGDLDDLLQRSFPNAGDEARIRRMFEDSLQDDALDMMTRREKGKIFYGFPIAILAAINGGRREDTGAPSSPNRDIRSV
jgi:ubiquinone/menaquinone biosynthesis C-methylase UbiE